MDCALPELVIKRVDVITINDEEARQLSGEYSLVSCCKNSTMGPCVIKKVNMELIFTISSLRRHCTIRRSI
jgi:hypothetical protein